MSQEKGQNPHIGEYIKYDMHRCANSKLLARNQVSREKNPACLSITLLV